MNSYVKFCSATMNAQNRSKAKKHASRQTLESCTIRLDEFDLEIKVGDDILLKAPEGRGPYVAKVVEITTDRRGRNLRIAGKWYYHPEDAWGGRRSFHGWKELFRSRHVDVQTPDSIEGKCKVHTFEEYMNLDEVEESDYYYRMDYDPDTEELHPSRLQVFCSCEFPWNPDHMMVNCDNCDEWFHPECEGWSREEAERMDKFICNACRSLIATLQRQTSNSEEEPANKRPRVDASLPCNPNEMPDNDADVP